MENDNHEKDMQHNVFRAFPRYPSDSRIKVYKRYPEEDSAFEARMYNLSRGGMYFEGDEYLSPQSQVFVSPIDQVQAGISLPEDRTLGLIKRCRQKDEAGGFTYGFGLQFLVNACDKCGEMVSSGSIHRTSEANLLCMRCLEGLNSMSEGKIKDLIRRYLLGNVI
jgi:hypothetical protein